MERNQMSLIIFEVKSISFRFGLVAKIFDSVVSITYDIERKSLLVWRMCSRNLAIDKSSVTYAEFFYVVIITAFIIAYLYT